MTRILHISDGHGFMPVADASLGVDLVCMTGDDSAEYNRNLSRQLRFARQALVPALEAWDCPVIATPGNHNHLAIQPWGILLLREMFEARGWHYLIDEGCEVLGLNFWGSPWTAPMGQSVFALPEIEMARKWAMIPEGLDALLTHNPPAGWLDRGYGSPSLREHLGWARPRVHMFGHIHPEAGVEGSYTTLYSNGSLVGGDMLPLGLATIIDLGDDGTVDFERVEVDIKDYLSAA